MVTSLEESENWDESRKIHANNFHLVKKIMKIGPVDPEVALLMLNKDEINVCKIYSPVGKCADRAKQIIIEARSWADCHTGWLDGQRTFGLSGCISICWFEKLW